MSELNVVIDVSHHSQNLHFAAIRTHCRRATQLVRLDDVAIHRWRRRSQSHTVPGAGMCAISSTAMKPLSAPSGAQPSQCRPFSKSGRRHRRPRRPLHFPARFLESELSL
jgi:hypothetical protein